MDPELRSRIKEALLHWEALAPAAREAYLAGLARTSPELEHEVRSLLDQLPIPDSFEVGELLESVLPEPADADAASTLRSLGPYRLLEVLGTGGMGIVYRARQEEPLRREVAVKLLRAGLDAGRILGRFMAERRAMALLEHPAIARILDAGQDVDGMPYLVTELVRGEPISDYCQARRLPVPQILDLFIEVCRAVQHAHQRGIIHRDLKPSNVMITEVDGQPRPKVIDFGIARILEEETGVQPTLTFEGQAIGTLGYMSPEQAAGRSRAVDTRSDVYSLGALLYELLTGALPHAIEGLSTTAALAMLSRESARPFRMLPPGHARLDAEIETIVLKALEREPERRYESPGALADDLERYRRHDAILARPPSTAYVLRKLVRRHRTAFAVGSAAILLLTAFTIIVSVLYTGQRRERQEAEVEASRTAAMNRFLLTMLGAASPEAMGRSVTVREVLDRAIPTVDRNFAHEPLVQAAVIATLGTTYRGLGQYAIADSLLQRGLALERQARGARHVEVARDLRELADNAMRWRHRELADSLCRLALAMSQEVAGPRSVEVASCLLLTSDIQTLLGHAAAAESTARRYLDLARSLHGERSAEFGRGMLRMGNAREITNDGQAGYYRAAAEILTQALGPDDAETLDALDAYAFHLKGRQGETIERNVLARMRRTHGETHPRVAQVEYRLATVLAERGAIAEAESLQRHGIATLRAAMGEKNTLLPPAYDQMADLARRRGDLAVAEAWYRRALNLSLEIHPEEHPRSVGEMQSLAHLLTQRGKHREADSLFRRAVAIRRRAYGVDSPASVGFFGEYGHYLFERGRLDSARVFLETAVSHSDPRGPMATYMRLELAICLGAGEAPERGDSLMALTAHDLLADPRPGPEQRAVLRRVAAYYGSRKQFDLASRYRDKADAR